MEEMFDFTLSDWKKGFYWGLVNINTSLNSDLKNPIQDIDLFEVISVLNLISSDDYQPDVFFKEGKALYENKKLSLDMPELEVDAQYPIIRLNIATPDMMGGEKNAGGIVFEDPLIALCAAKALSINPDNLKAFIASEDADDLFALRTKLLSLLENKFFDGSPFFIGGEKYINDIKMPSFDIVFLKGEEIETLREHSIAPVFINGELLLAQLYAQ